MRTDVMSGSGLAVYAELAMILFFAAFVAIAVWIWLPRNRKTWDAASACRSTTCIPRNRVPARRNNDHEPRFRRGTPPRP